MDDVEAQGRYFIEILAGDPYSLTKEEFTRIACIIDALLEERKG